MHIFHSNYSLICMPQEIKETIFESVIDPFDDIVDSKHVVQAGLSQLLNLRLISKRLDINTPYLRELFVKLWTLQFDIAPSLARLERNLPQAAGFLRRIRCKSLLRSSFIEQTREQLLVLILPIFNELFVDIGALDFSNRATIYWKTTPAQRKANKRIAVRAVLPALPACKVGATVQVRYDVQFDLDEKVEDLLRVVPVQRVHLVSQLRLYDNRRWQESSFIECLHRHSQVGAEYVLEQIYGLRAGYGDGWVWKRSTESCDVLKSNQGWTCECE